VRDLGPRATLGAPLIVMAIIGGAVFPPLMGLIDVRHAMLVPALAFAVVLGFALRMARVASGAAAA